MLADEAERLSSRDIRQRCESAGEGESEALACPLRSRDANMGKSDEFLGYLTALEG